MKHHFRIEPGEGYTAIVKPGQGELKYVELGILNLPTGGSYRFDSEGREAFFVLLEGSGRIEVAGGEAWAIARKSPFDEPAAGGYFPPGTTVSVCADGKLQAALAFAPASAGFPARPIVQDEITVADRGEPPFLRRVSEVALLKFPAERLLIGETINAQGQWSGYPPHKHDEVNPPAELPAEEVYYFRFAPSQGFGLQWLYSYDGSLDEPLALRDGDVVTMPRGHHPVVAAPGYRMYYLWVLAGPERALQPSEDPAHVWVKTALANPPVPPTRG